MSTAPQSSDTGRSPRAAIRRAQARREQLPEDGTVVFAAERTSSGIDEVLAALVGGTSHDPGRPPAGAG